MAANLNITSRMMDAMVLVEINGEIDISTVNELKERLYQIVEENPNNIKLDCSSLTYIDSTGLGALVGALKKVKSHNKDIYIANLKSNIKKLFLITGLDKVFKIEE